MERIDNLLDYADALACKIGLRSVAGWDAAHSLAPLRLYAGKVRRALPQYKTHLGMTPFFPSSRNIPHDICAPIPLPENSVDVYQSEDVFEHIPYAVLPFVFSEIFRVLKPDGLFRLSLPDYGADVYRDRSVKNMHGDIVFDAGGGGNFLNGKVVDGGHLWFPTFSLVQDLFENSAFSQRGSFRFLHATLEPDKFLLEPIDYSLGMIQRTPDHDARAVNPRRPLSIVVDALKRGL